MEHLNVASLIQVPLCYNLKTLNKWDGLCIIEVVKSVGRDCGAMPLFKKYLLCPVLLTYSRRRKKKKHSDSL